MDTFLEIKQQNFSILGKNSRFTGEFHLQGNTHISSFVEGEIYLGEEGKLTIERTGHMIGTVHCYEMEIYGQFSGTIHSQGRVIIWPSALVQGKIEAKNLVIYPGSIVEIEAVTTN